MDSITFELGDTTIQLVDGRVYLWMADVDNELRITLNIKQLQDALSTAHMLIRERK